jgi:hypothetical protein
MTWSRIGNRSFYISMQITVEADEAVEAVYWLGYLTWETWALHTTEVSLSGHIKEQSSLHIRE